MSTLKAKALKWELRHEGQPYAEHIARNTKGIVLSIRPSKNILAFEKYYFYMNGSTISSHHTLESAKEAAQLYIDHLVRTFAE